MYYVLINIDQLWAGYGQDQNPCGSIWLDRDVFLSTLFLFLIMNLIEAIMYKLCAGYEMHKLYYKLHMLIMGIMNRSWFDHTGRPTF